MVIVVLVSSGSVSGWRSRLSQSGMGNTMHITASVFINDNESGLHADYERWLEELVRSNAGSDSASGGYLHNRTGDDNANARHKRQRMGREVVAAITDGAVGGKPGTLRGGVGGNPEGPGSAAG